MTGFAVKPLSQSTWPDFAALVERHNGVWGGCWCMAFHPEGVGRGKTAAQNRTEKECRAREGTAHATLVYDGRTCVGWCQFGSPEELPRIKRQRACGLSRNEAVCIQKSGCLLNEQAVPPPRGKLRLPVFKGRGGRVAGVDPLSNKALLEALGDDA